MFIFIYIYCSSLYLLVRKNGYFSAADISFGHLVFASLVRKAPIQLALLACSSMQRNIHSSTNIDVKSYLAEVMSPL